MNKILILFFIALTTVSFGQKSKELSFDIADFNQKAEVAEWLYQYDMVAWRTSDSVMSEDKNEIARLGTEWFCFEVNETWHAIYGKYENNKFDLVFHYKMDRNGQVIRTIESVDTTLLNTYSRALQTANTQIKALKDTVSLKFNQYIKENEDKTFTVWLLPAFQPNSVAVYGGEFIYTIDPTGTRLLKDDSYFQGEFRGFKVNNPREIWLNYQETEKPTLGTVFFVWYYKSYFTKIIIDNSKSITSAIKSDDQWTWIHAIKEPKKSRKKRK